MVSWHPHAYTHSHYIFGLCWRPLLDQWQSWCLQGQSKLGRVVSGMRFQTSPHVDHFRNNTTAYTEGLRQFVADALALTDPSRPAPNVMSQLQPAIYTPDAT